MKSNPIGFVRSAAAIAIVISLAALAKPALSQPSAETGTAAAPAPQRWHQRENIQARLDRMAKRLHITPAQQAAWAAYADTVKNLAGTRPLKPVPNADAASVIRFRADRAAERAQKLSKLADATAALQQALDPGQQQTLGEMMRHAGQRTGHGEHSWR